MNVFPIDPWSSSCQKMIDTIDNKTSNATFDGVPVLAIAVFRVSPDIEVVKALLNHGADSHAIYMGVPIIQYVFSGEFPEWFMEPFRPLRERVTLSETIGVAKPAVKVRPL